MTASVAFAAVDADSAQELLKKSDCMKYHALDKNKDGPAYKDVAKKYKGKADAEDKLIKHVTLRPMIEIDGKKEEHKGTIHDKNRTGVRATCADCHVPHAPVPLYIAKIGALNDL